MRDALQAGKDELIRPINNAVAIQRPATPGEISKVRSAPVKFPPGPLRITPQMPDARRHPRAPPTIEMKADSPRTMNNIAPGVKPSVFKMPTSRIRSRTDIEMVLPDTSSTVNVTAPKMAMMNSLRLPTNAAKPS